MVFALFVIAVSIGGLHHYIIAVRNILGIPDQRFILVSDITGKDDLSLFIPFCRPNLNRG